MPSAREQLGESGRTQTRNFHVRSVALCSVELPIHGVGSVKSQPHFL
jgi:hypothetical protein